MINSYMKNVLILAVIYIFLIKKCFSNDAHTNLISILEMNYPLEFSFEQKYNNDIDKAYLENNNTITKKQARNTINTNSKHDDSIQSNND